MTTKPTWYKFAQQYMKLHDNTSHFQSVGYSSAIVGQQIPAMYGKRDIQQGHDKFFTSADLIFKGFRQI